MFDLTRLGEFVGDIFNLANTETGLDKILQQLGDQGIDLSQFEGLDANTLMDALAQNGIDVSQLDAGQLSQLADHLGIELPLGDLIDPFLTRSGEQ